MPWLKTVGCDCPECGVDECDPGCACSFFAGELLQAGYDDTFDWSSVNSIDHDVDIVVFDYAACDGPPTTDYYYQITVWADGVVIFGSGASTGNFAASATVPAGTTSLRILVEYFPDGTTCEDSGSGEWYVQCQ